ncbi:hypothetical protein [Streptomyces sp. MAA16]|nr:hypothetical protein [Streptomyces sp. MAA16]MDH6698576.1 hypothetical protein [Streptomyces sp. MAA16]
MDDDLITERRPVTFPQVFGYLRHRRSAPPYGARRLPHRILRTGTN